MLNCLFLVYMFFISRSSIWFLFKAACLKSLALYAHFQSLLSSWEVISSSTFNCTSHFPHEWLFYWSSSLPAVSFCGHFTLSLFCGISSRPAARGLQTFFFHWAPERYWLEISLNWILNLRFFWPPEKSKFELKLTW